jgi:2'-deoxynucleoside 5'-phosphate N-hydrolase
VKIYFAGSIRGGRDDWAIYRDIIGVLSEYGTVSTEHIGSSELEITGEDLEDRAVHDRDLGWLRDSDYLVAEVTTPSLGVGYEIAKATEWGKPVLCLFRPDRNRRLSAMIAGSDGVQLSTYVDVRDLSEIVERFFSTTRSPLTP